MSFHLGTVDWLQQSLSAICLPEYPSSASTITLTRFSFLVHVRGFICHETWLNGLQIWLKRCPWHINIFRCSLVCTLKLAPQLADNYHGCWWRELCTFSFHVVQIPSVNRTPQLPKLPVFRVSAEVEPILLLDFTKAQEWSELCVFWLGILAATFQPCYI